MNFVINCPACSPAFDAFNLYASRSRLSSQPKKWTSYRTFGPGLDQSVKEGLAQPGLSCREAIQGLIQKWVDERINRLRMNPAETKTLRDKLAKMRKDGEAMLKSIQDGNNGEELMEIYKDWKECPICSGASPSAMPGGPK